jgi:hypothetical protein
MRPMHRPDPVFKNVPSDLWAKYSDNCQSNLDSSTDSSSGVSARVRLFLLRNCNNVNNIEDLSTDEQPDSDAPSPCKVSSISGFRDRVEKLVDRTAFSMYKAILKIENAIHSRSTSRP